MWGTDSVHNLVKFEIWGKDSGHNLVKFEMWGTDSGVVGDIGLVGYDIMSMDEWYVRAVAFRAKPYKSPENQDTTLLFNVRKQSLDDKGSCPNNS
jgi:hypothetical protein